MITDAIKWEMKFRLEMNNTTRMMLFIDDKETYSIIKNTTFGAMYFEEDKYGNHIPLHEISNDNDAELYLKNKYIKHGAPKIPFDFEGKTIVFDFDGVIHDYKEGWKDGSIYGDVVPGIAKVISTIRTYNAKVVIQSTRSATEEGCEKLRKWLTDRNVEFDDISQHKVPAIMYIDDRGIQFNGDSKNLLQDILTFKHYLDK